MPKSKKWWKSKRVWSAVSFGLSGTGAILNRVAGGNQGVEVTALSCMLAAGLVNIVFGLKDSGTKVDMPDFIGDAKRYAAQSKSVQDFRASMQQMADALNHRGPREPPR